MRIPCPNCGAGMYRDSGYYCGCEDSEYVPPDERPERYTRTVEAWQWNGPEDNRGVVEACQDCPHIGFDGHIHGEIIATGEPVSAGDWLVKHRPFGIIHLTNAEFMAQGWKKGEDK